LSLKQGVGTDNTPFLLQKCNIRGDSTSSLDKFFRFGNVAHAVRKKPHDRGGKLAQVSLPKGQ
jgi:hypothetical protein